jgi:hypothetical protein
VGERGEPGLVGPQGLQGERGADGLNGRDGIDGKDGLSAYDIAKAHGYAGSELEWLQSIHGKDGASGRDGRDGKDGEAGRDALQIDILPAIDEARSYPRGTYARVRGCIAKSVRQTGPLGDDLAAAGWQVLIDGLQDVQMEMAEDMRSFRISMCWGSGAVVQRSFKLPGMLYRDVWSKERAYDTGDVVTYGGQMWVCLKDETADQPGTSPAWRLSVRKGRDAAPVDEPKPREPVRLR